MPDEAERPEPETTTTRRQPLAASSREERPPSADAEVEAPPLLGASLSQLFFFQEVEVEKKG